jgi:glycerophosphoryl diester phosphodiesterase
LISYIFLKCPHLLHTKKTKLKLPPRDQIEGSHYLLAHRGGSMEVLENSIPGFEYALANGVHIVECDVRMTKDEEIFIAHD